MEKKGHAAQGRTEIHTRYWRGSQQNIDHIENIGVYGGVTLQELVRNMGVRRGMDLSISGYGQVVDSHRLGKDLGVFMKRREIPWLGEN